jgi:nucleoside-diphosphate-sugar epimerase
MARRIAKRQRSYPGLVEIFGAFYDAIRTNGDSPVTRSNLIETVSICERIAEALAASYRVEEAGSMREGAAPVIVTGGTGFLGKEVVKVLSEAGDPVRVVARRAPPAWERVPGVEYVVADISRPLHASVFGGASAVIHCAAETAGGWREHERNSVAATENVVVAAAAAGIARLIHVSSISVLSVPSRGKALSEATPVEPDSRTGGPYAWGKIQSESIAVTRGKELGIGVRIVRPSALVDYRQFDPPGLLGKRAGNIFVAVGLPEHELGVVDVVFSARALAWMVRHFDEAPQVINLFDPQLPTRRQLLSRLRRVNPDLTIVWLPPVVLVPLSWLGIVIQHILRPGKPAINVAKIFARLRYDTSLIAGLAPTIDSASSQIQRREDGVHDVSVKNSRAASRLAMSTGASA